MSSFSFEMTLIAAFATDNSEIFESKKIVSSTTPLSAGDFDVLNGDIIAYIGSCMPMLSLEKGQKLDSLCEIFHTHMVPQMRFSWRPFKSVLSIDSPFVIRCAPGIFTVE